MLKSRSPFLHSGHWSTIMTVTSLPRTRHSGSTQRTRAHLHVHARGMVWLGVSRRPGEGGRVGGTDV